MSVKTKSDGISGLNNVCELITYKVIEGNVDPPKCKIKQHKWWQFWRW